jgi:hypothetical protein
MRRIRRMNPTRCGRSCRNCTDGYFQFPSVRILSICFPTFASVSRVARTSTLISRSRQSRSMIEFSSRCIREFNSFSCPRLCVLRIHAISFHVPGAVFRQQVDQRLQKHKRPDGAADCETCAVPARPAVNINGCDDCRPSEQIDYGNSSPHLRDPPVPKCDSNSAGSGRNAKRLHRELGVLPLSFICDTKMSGDRPPTHSVSQRLQHCQLPPC